MSVRHPPTGCLHRFRFGPMSRRARWGCKRRTRRACGGARVDEPRERQRWSRRRRDGALTRARASRSEIV